MSIAKRFSVDSIKYEFGNTGKVEFQLFFKTSDISNISDMNKICTIRANTSIRSLIRNICKQLTLHLQPSPNYQTIREGLYEGFK